LKTALALLAAIAGLSFPAIAQDKSVQDKSERLKIVNCYDPGRNIVRRTALWKCKGEAVSDARAQEIKASRIRRAKGKLQPSKALYPGLKMRSSGSGFFVSGDGHVLTNDHVIAGCRRVSVKPTDVRDHLPATVIGSDKPDDLAVLKYSGTTVAVAKFRKPLNLQVGDKVAVIGHPLHGLVAIKPIFVTGKVRAFQEQKLQRWGRFAIDADIRRGNSGGPVIDDRGYVIGVVSAKINTPAMFQRTGEVLRDIGLIIRQDRALRFLDRFGVAYTGDDRRPTLDDATLSGLAYAFVARIGCWK
jgi:serine protease Do